MIRNVVSGQVNEAVGIIGSDKPKGTPAQYGKQVDIKPRGDEDTHPNAGATNNASSRVKKKDDLAQDIKMEDVPPNNGSAAAVTNSDGTMNEKKKLKIKEDAAYTANDGNTKFDPAVPSEGISKGTKERRKVDVVGRGEDPTSSKSKLAKQGEYKTKIVEFALRDTIRAIMEKTATGTEISSKKNMSDDGDSKVIQGKTKVIHNGKTEIVINPELNKDRLKEDMNVRVNGGAGTTQYKIQKGDTLSQIAVKNGVSVADLARANPNIRDLNKIGVNDTLTMPSGAVQSSNPYKSGVGAQGMTDMSDPATLAASQAASRRTTQRSPSQLPQGEPTRPATISQQAPGDQTPAQQTAARYPSISTPTPPSPFGGLTNPNPPARFGLGPNEVDTSVPKIQSASSQAQSPVLSLGKEKGDRSRGVSVAPAPLTPDDKYVPPNAGKPLQNPNQMRSLSGQPMTDLMGRPINRLSVAPTPPEPPAQPPAPNPAYDRSASPQFNQPEISQSGQMQNALNNTKTNPYVPPARPATPLQPPADASGRPMSPGAQAGAAISKAVASPPPPQAGALPPITPISAKPGINVSTGPARSKPSPITVNNGKPTSTDDIDQQGKTKVTESRLISAFFALQNNKRENMFEAAKKVASKVKDKKLEEDDDADPIGTLIKKMPPAPASPTAPTPPVRPSSLTPPKPKKNPDPGSITGMNTIESVENLKEKNWIAGAIKHPGALHKALNVPKGEKIPADKLNVAAEKGGKIGKEANLAKTLKSFSETLAGMRNVDEGKNDSIDADARKINKKLKSAAKPVDEDVLDELTQEKLKKYIPAAAKSDKDFKQPEGKRMKSISLAIDKVYPSTAQNMPKVIAKESIEDLFTEAELAHMASVDEDMAVAKTAPDIAYGKGDSTSDKQASVTLTDSKKTKFNKNK